MKYFSKRIFSVVLAASLAVGGSSAVMARGRGRGRGGRAKSTKAVKLEPAYLANVLIGMNNNQKFFNFEDLKNLACVSKESATAMDMVRIFDFTHMEEITDVTIAERKLRDAFRFYPNIETIACSANQLKLFVKSESIMNFLREIMQRSGRSLTFELRDSARSITVLLMDCDTTQCSGISAIEDHQQKLNGFKVKCHEVAGISWGGEVDEVAVRCIKLVADNIKSQDGTIIGCCCFYNTNTEGKLNDLSASCLEKLKAVIPDIKLFSDVDARASLLMPEKSEKDHATLSLILGSKSRFVPHSDENSLSSDLYILAQHIHDLTRKET